MLYTVNEFRGVETLVCARISKSEFLLFLELGSKRMMSFMSGSCVPTYIGTVHIILYSV